MILAPEECACPYVDEGVSISTSSVCNGTILFMMLLEGYLRGRCNIANPCQRIESVENLEKEYDFIVVGAGAAGSVLAGRLSEEKSYNVLLIEAGGVEPIMSKIPSFYIAFWGHEELDWNYRTVPDNYCLDQNGGGCVWPRGKVMGGSTLLNGMMYHRGHPSDYDDWVNAGATGWSWDDNVKYFDMTEGNKQIGDLVSAEYHSASGPLPVQQFNHHPEMVDDLLHAIDAAGFPVIKDMNDPNTPDGFTIAQTFNENGQRYTTARAFLKPKSERPNLSVKMNALVSKVLFDGNRAIGVEFIDKNGETKTVHATKEVILSAGALNTPQILLLSGIGPRPILEQHKIPLIADLPVGTNLRNHIGGTFYYTLEEMNNTRTLDWSASTEYLLKREGPMSGTGITQLTGLLYSTLGDYNRRQPDIQFFFNGFYADCSMTGVVGETACPEKGYNISVNTVALLPKSVGYLTLNSTDPRDPPLFYPNYFDHPDDMTVVKEGARYMKRIFDDKNLQNKYGVKLQPGSKTPCEKSGAEWSDEWLECTIRVHTDPQNHQVGTAAIARVVDTDLKVYNVTGLRVIDASVIPTLVSGNPQGAIMLVAERGAELIKQEHKTR